MKKLLIINIKNPNLHDGGQSTFINNIHPYIFSEFNVSYLFLKSNPIPRILPDRVLLFIKLFFFLIQHRGTYDFFLSHTPEASFLLAKFNLKFIHIFHGNNNPVIQSKFWYGKYFVSIYNYFEGIIINRASYLYTVGEEKQNTERLYSPINFKVNPLKSKRNLIFAGRLEKVKNIDRLINIYLKLPEHIQKEHNLLIFGTGTKKNVLQNLIQKNNANDKIKLMGHKDNNKIIEILNQSKILVMASMFEGFPMVIAESLSVGTPVVSSDVGSINTIIQNGFNGFCLDNKEADSAFVNAIVDILNNYTQYSENAYNSSNIFSAEKIASKIIQQIKKLI